MSTMRIEGHIRRAHMLVQKDLTGRRNRSTPIPKVREHSKDRIVRRKRSLPEIIQLCAEGLRMPNPAWSAPRPPSGHRIRMRSGRQTARRACASPRNDQPSSSPGTAPPTRRRLLDVWRRSQEIRTHLRYRHKHAFRLRPSRDSAGHWPRHACH